MNGEKENDGSSKDNSNLHGANVSARVTVMKKEIANFVPREKA